MKKLVIACASALSLAILAISAAAADRAEHAAAEQAGKSVERTSEPRAANDQTAVACNLCFTCGGDWPVFAGSFTTASAQTTERGGSCNGALISRPDSNPFLCCR